jgi:hypothetical protein
VQTFSPLGSWDPHSAIAPGLVGKGQKFFAELVPVPDGSYLEAIMLHWEVEPMCVAAAQYNATATFANGGWGMTLGTSVLGNASGDSLTEAEHTWHRNGHSFGLSLAGMDGATVENFGPDPVTHAGLDTVLMMAAAIAVRYSIDALGLVDRYDAYYNPVLEQTIMTHAEIALVDKYFPGDLDPATGKPDPDSRWDFATTVPPPHGTPLDRAWPKIVGDAFRDRIHSYKVALLHA